MNNWNVWYESLKKPPFTPQAGVIGLIWTLLYPIIIVSFGYSFYLFTQGKMVAWMLIPFVVNIIANIAFTPLFMGQRNLTLASLDIFVVWASIIVIMVMMWPISRGVVYAQIPYLIWVSLAMFFMFGIYFLNR